MTIIQLWSWTMSQLYQIIRAQTKKKKQKKRVYWAHLVYFHYFLRIFKYHFPIQKAMFKSFSTFEFLKKNQTTYNLMITKWILKESIQLSQNYLPKRYIDFFFFSFQITILNILIFLGLENHISCDLHTCILCY